MSRASGRKHPGLTDWRPEMMNTRCCPHCGRSMTGLRLNHAELCVLLSATRGELPASEPVIAPAVVDAPAVRKRILTEAQMLDYMDGRLTRAEIESTYRAA